MMMLSLHSFCSCVALKSIMLYSICGQKAAAQQRFWRRPP